MKRRSAPNDAEITRAIQRARAGSGWALASLIKGFSAADLAKSIGRVSERQGISESWLGCVLSHASGMKEERARWAKKRQAARRDVR